VVASSRGKQPHCPVGKHEQAHGSRCHERVVYPLSETRPLIGLLGLSSTLCKISILPLVLGLLLRICFPFLRRWRRILPNASGSRQVERGGYRPPDRIVGRLNDAPAATLEPEMSSISSRDQCLSMMRGHTFCVSAGSESRLFGLHLLRRSSALLLSSTCPKAPVPAVPLELVADAGAVPADLCRDIADWPSLCMQRGYAVPLLRAKMCVVAHSFQLSTLMWTTNIVAFRSVPRLYSVGYPVALRMLIHRDHDNYPSSFPSTQILLSWLYYPPLPQKLSSYTMTCHFDRRLKINRCCIERQWSIA